MSTLAKMIGIGRATLYRAFEKLEFSGLIIKNDKNILAVFSGHQHMPSVIDEDGVRYYVLGSMIADESMTDTPLGEYLEIDLEDGEIKVTERRIKKDDLRIN